MEAALPPIPGLILVALLLGLNALFVAAEFAYVTVRRTRLQHLASEGNTRAGVLLRALGNLDFYVAAFQLGITMTTIALGFLGEPVLASLIEPPLEDLTGPAAPALSHTIAIIVAFTLINALHIVVGEFVPKSLALAQPDRTALWLSLPMEAFARVFRPAIWLLNETGNVILRLIGFDVRPVGDEPLQIEDIAMTLETSASAGLISRREFDLTRNLLRLSTITASDLMAPRNAIVAIPSDASIEEVRQTFARHRFTRYPVYDGTIDNIIGILDVKSATFDLAQGDDWKQDIEPPLVLPETVTVQNALTAAQQAGVTMIVLVDEFGGTAGILSVFDIVQYLAGGLPDEYRIRPPEIEPRPDGSLVISGQLSIVELEDELDIELPEFDSHTVGGMVTELLQRLPQAGDEVDLENCRLQVLEANHHRVERILVTPVEFARESEGGDER